jgi:hypothetical protein
MVKRPTKPATREPLTKEQLKRLPIGEVEKLRLTAEEIRLFREINDELATERDAKAKALAADEVSLVADLNKVGCDAKSVWDLGSSITSYKEAIPVLAAHLEAPHLDRVVAAIARALAVKEAKHLWPLLASKFKEAPEGVGSDGYPLWAKDAFAATLASICTDDKLSEVVDLLRDATNGKARLLLLDALRNSRDPRAKAAIEELAFDSLLAQEIARWQKKKPQPSKH